MAKTKKNKWRIRQAIQKTKKGGYRGLLIVGNLVGDEAQRLAPMDEGELETSLKVAGDKSKMMVAIGFSKMVNGVDVAVIQHETPNPPYNHLPGRQWKYLQQPLFSTGVMWMPNILRDEIEKELV